MVFDGRQMAKELEEELKFLTQQVSNRLGRKLKLAVIRDPNNTASVSYTGVKKKMADRLGVEFAVEDAASIEKWNRDETIDGIMVQLPFSGSGKLISAIDPKKDVDGLRSDSPFLPATVRAVLAIIDIAGVSGDKKILVVGNKGEVGRRVSSELEAEGMDKDDFDPLKLKKADVIVGATGQAGLIQPEMVKDGVVVIDVGYPKGDFDPGVAAKASFFTPVPGGVGPLTVVMLFKNLVEGVQT